MEKKIKLYFTYDEEIGFGGIYDIVKNKEKFPKFMVFGEPTYNEILIGCKGLLECELYFKGIKAHSSNPDKGESANLHAINFLGELEKFYIKNIKNETNSHYDIPYTTMNVGIINGGSAKNSIPAECYATLDFRLIEAKHSEKILAKIEELCEKYNCKNKVIENIYPFISDAEFEHNGKTANFMTEASFVDCKSKIILGVGPVTAHEVNEHIEIKSYEKLKKQYKQLIEKFA
ncbi:MAG: M20/M25/M40 family metallo-hydrolase [Clostridia bacterium]|nr:M20/M25/M40 family metallo-hydrolase [Clostridia bacterium]